MVFHRRYLGGPNPALRLRINGRTMTRKLDQLIDAISEGVRGAGLQTRMDELETRKAVLQAELAAPPPSPVRLHPNLAVLYRERVDRLQESLSDPSLRTEAIGILRELIDVVKVCPGDPPVLELQGQIAGLVQLAAGGEAGKQIASLMAGEVSGDFKSSVKVVAGTGNRLNFLSTAR